MDQYSYIANSDAAYVDQLYQSYKQDPQSVDESWQQFFKGFEFSLTYGENAKGTNGKTNGASTNGNGAAQAGASTKPVDASHAGFIETPDDVAERIRKCLPYVPAEKLAVAPDCGLSQTARWAAKQKLANMVAGAKMVRSEL